MRLQQPLPGNRQPSAVQKGCPCLGSAKSGHIFPFLLPRELCWKSLSYMTCFFGGHIMRLTSSHPTMPSCCDGGCTRPSPLALSSCSFLQERAVDVLPINTKVFRYLKDKFTDVQSVLYCYNVDSYYEQCVLYLHATSTQITLFICQQKSAEWRKMSFWVIQQTFDSSNFY